MKKSLLAFALLTATSLSHAGVFKCEVNGKPVFQDKPCAGQTTQKAVVAPARNEVNEIQPYSMPTTKENWHDVAIVEGYSADKRQEAINTAHTVVKDNLVDPESAVFKGVKIHQRRDDTTGVTETRLCGYVNSKNRMGGYSGFKSFVFIVGQPHISISDTDGSVCDLKGETL